MKKSIHGKIDGNEVFIYTLRNQSGMEVQVSELGASLVSVKIPVAGKLQEVSLGHAAFDGWVNNGPYLGATVGRFGNRIKDGKFELNGKLYELACNNAPNDIPCHLHGGNVGFNQKVWKSEVLMEDGCEAVKFSLRSEDGDEGYPGNLDVMVTYSLNDANELSWVAEAVTDAPTPVNIINHTYWNLSGDLDSSVADHLVQIKADQFTPKDAGMIPTGEFRDVAGTPMDLNSPVRIGDGLVSSYECIVNSGGYDHNYVLNKSSDGAIEWVGKVSHPVTGVTMELLTDQDGVQFYTGNFLDGEQVGYDGCCYPRQSGFCLETQAFPDAPNHPEFPSCILNPGENYKHSMVLRFTTS